MPHLLTTILPEYPRTRHLPHKANARRDDLIASREEIEILWQSPSLVVEEKIDGANCGMTVHNGEPVIRNRSHILDKAYSKARTAAKLQFSSVWNWWYVHRGNFLRLQRLAGNVSVYGDWMFMQHGMKYNRLPSLFMTYDLYDWESRSFLDSLLSRRLLEMSGFSTVPLLHTGPINSLEFLESLVDQRSDYSEENREGVYLKVSDGRKTTHRFKMVREGFVQGGLLSKSEIKKNVVMRP